MTFGGAQHSHALRTARRHSRARRFYSGNYVPAGCGKRSADGSRSVPECGSRGDRRRNAEAFRMNGSREAPCGRTNDHDPVLCSYTSGRRAGGSPLKRRELKGTTMGASRTGPAYVTYNGQTWYFYVGVSSGDKYRLNYKIAVEGNNP